MPSLFRFLAAVAIIVGVVYGGMLALTVLVQPQSREISVTIPQDRFSQASASERWRRRMPRHGSPIGRHADRAVSRHAGGRARRAPEYASGLSLRPGRFLRLSSSAREPALRGRLERRHPRLSRRACKRGLQRRLRSRANFPRCASSIASSMPNVTARDDPAAILEGPKRGRSLPKTLSIADVDRLIAPRVRMRTMRGASAGERQRAAHGSLPAGTALRHRPARLGTGRAAGIRRAARPAHADGARQGRQGAHGAAQRRGAPGDGALPRAA